VTVVLRVREPLSWYRSYYDWAVLGRQRGGEARQQWGANFTDWLPPNLQSALLFLPGYSAQHAVRTSAPRPSRWRRISAALAQVDVLAPLERLDEAAAVVMHKAGFLQPTGYERFAPGPTSGAWSRRKAQLPVQASGDFCAAGPRLRACEAAVLAAAPDDHRLYQLAVERFAAQVASLRGVPTFARTLEAHFAAVAAVGQAAAGR